MSRSRKYEYLFQNKSTLAQVFYGEKKSEIADGHRSKDKNTSYLPKEALFGLTLRIRTTC